MNRTIKLTIAYDGTNFSGWQRQADVRSVQEEIEKILFRMHEHAVTLSGAGRTDSGVHARGQAAHFRTDLESIPPLKFIPALNSLLPRDVRILAAEQVHDGFHARFDALSRTYRYFITPARVQLPNDRLYKWRINRKPDIALLNRSAACLAGEHDFTAFANPRDESLSRFRYVHSAAFFADGPDLVFEITANAFLWKMVRSITGSLIAFEAAGKPPEYFKDVLEAKNRSLAGATAPAHGLFLWKVAYI